MIGCIKLSPRTSCGVAFMIKVFPVQDRDDIVLVMFRFKNNQDGIDNDTNSKKTGGAKPQNTSPHFSFVKAMYPKVSDKNTEGEGDPFIVFTSRRHNDSSFLILMHNLENWVTND